MSVSQKPFSMDEIFWADMRREFTENLLTTNGDFLMWKDSKGEVLSVFWNGVKHFKPINKGWEYSFGMKSFITLEEVLHYHFIYKIPLGSTEIMLMKPVKKTKTLFRLSDVEILGRLDEGSFSKISKVKIKQDGRLAAMKTPKENVPKAARETFVKEMVLMQTMDHVNVVKCLGVIDEGDGQLRILMELINKGSMEKLLGQNLKLSDRGKVRTLLDVASGVSYLHRMGVIHRDLRTRKILLHLTNYGKIVAKVSDFFLCRQDETTGGRGGYELKTSTKLSPKWMSPECFKFKRWTKASDVWSFGVLMWEMWSNAADPYHDVPQAQGVSNLFKYVSGGGHVTRPDGCRDDVWLLMLKIFTPNDAKRITIDDVYDDLERINAIVKMEE